MGAVLGCEFRKMTDGLQFQPFDGFGWAAEKQSTLVHRIMVQHGSYEHYPFRRFQPCDMAQEVSQFQLTRLLPTNV